MPSDADPGGRIALSVAELLVAGERLRKRIETECFVSLELERHPGDIEFAERWRLARRKTELALRTYSTALARCAETAREAGGSRVSRKRFWTRLAGTAVS